MATSNCTDNLANQTVSRSGTFLTLEFSRPINASDYCDYPIDLEGSNHLVYGVGPAVATYQWPYNFQYHLVRANISFAFITTLPATTATIPTATSTPTTMATVNNGTTNFATATMPATMPATTGSPIAAPPTLSGYANSFDFSLNLTNGFTPAVAPQYYHIYYTYTPPTLSMGIVAYSVDGWLGFGWSPSGIMDALGMLSDAALAYVDPMGQMFVTDFALIGRVAPTAAGCINTTTGICGDTTILTGCLDNVSLKSLSRTGTYLLFEFTRPVIASDICDVAVLPSGSKNQNVIFAVGPTITSSPWPFNIQFHYYHTNGIFPFNWVPTASPATMAKSNGSQLPMSIFIILIVLGLLLL